MAQSLSKIYVHLVFSTKHRYPFLRDADLRERMHAYIGGILRGLDSHGLRVGGMSDHIHVLMQLPKNRALADVVGELKRNSSKWVKVATSDMSKFAWQNGYAAFSVGESGVEGVRDYILRQEEHHHRISYQDEVRALLLEFRMEYDEGFLWD
jgi:putative transposase